MTALDDPVAHRRLPWHMRGSYAPVAVVGLPQRVPQGFHGSWFADE